jgi:NAD(P)-dependent dehydrogenase (short-subunit alcohol dehydrogenase family)
MKARPTPPRLVEMAYVPVKADLAGKVAVVTGANAGMGKATASELARMGAETVLACRNAERAEAAVRDIVAQTRVETVSANAARRVVAGVRPQLRSGAHGQIRAPRRAGQQRRRIGA